MSAYYNEIEPFAAAWLRNLISAGHIAAGDVDDRSIVDVRPADLDGYRQCHFFAGIGAWSYALRLAGWPDDREVWTGSCPCQPFSAAGRRRGFADERHLWPVWFELVRERRPAVVFGEQVASPAGLGWFDAVHADLEGAGYAVGAADLCAAGVGAPHIRQRLYFVADTLSAGRAEGWACAGDRPAAGSGGTGVLASSGSQQRNQRCGAAGGDGAEAADGSDACLMGYAGGEGLARRSSGPGDDGAQRPSAERAGGDAGGLGDPSGERWIGRQGLPPRRIDDRSNAGRVEGHNGPVGIGQAGAVRNPWANLEWLPCADGKARPTQPGLFPLAHGAPARVGRLRAYGNAINPWQAEAFIGAWLEMRAAA